MELSRQRVGDSGEIVAQLHEVLALHGVEVSPEERKRRFFGPSTRDAVREFQKQHGLEITGEVDEATAATLSAAPPASHRASLPGPSPVGLGSPFTPHSPAAQPTLNVPNASTGAKTDPHLVEGRIFLDQGREVDERTTRLINSLPGRVLPESSEGQPKPFIVRGQVRQADGAPLAGLVVRAFDKDMRSEELLGEVLTDQAGRYEIPYTTKQFSRAEKGSADLRVAVYNESGQEIASSPIVFNAQPIETVDHDVEGDYRSPSEYEELVRELTPVVLGVPLHELTGEDVMFLTGETGMDQQRITWIAESAKRAQETSIPAEAFYGWFRQNLPTDMDGLLDQNLDTLRRALDTAMNNTIIPLSVSDQGEQILHRLSSLKAERLLLPTGGNGKASLGDLLDIALPSREKQRALASVFVHHREIGDEFLEAARSKPELSPEEIDQVQVVLQLGELTQNNLPLIHELQQMWRHGEPSSLRYLANVDEDGWRELVSRHGVPPSVPGETSEEKIDNYTNALAHTIEDAFPTTVIAHRLEKDEKDDSPFKPMKADLKTFFANNPTFEFGATPIDLYLSEDRKKKLGGVDVDKTEELTAQLKSMQRVFKITPNFAQMSTLLADDLHSSQAIVYMGQRAFVDKYRETLGGKELAFATYKQAEHIHAMSLLLYARHSAAFNAPTPYVISGDTSEAVSRPMLLALTSTNNSASTNDTAWRTLFGSIDLCDCEHCKSVYSPAAYLVDILKFLNDGPTKNDKTPLQVLLERRPDLEHIELTCENTDTPLPYVDLVQEVLENAIAPFEPFVILPFKPPFPNEPAWMPQVDLDQNNLSIWVQAVFASKKITLAQNAIIKVVELGKHWLIVDHSRSYTVINEPSPRGAVRVISQNLQTGGTAEELGANPEHVNPAAYDTLRDAVYPWSLPLNLWVKEARVYLDQLGVQRHEVMETFFQGTPSTALTDEDIALEHLGLTMFEWLIITGGLKVRMATTTSLNVGPFGLTGMPYIDSVSVTLGDRVLVKDQLNAADNGIYIVQSNIFFLGKNLVLVRATDVAPLPTFVSVQAGASNQDSGWLLTHGANGEYSVAELPPWEWWGLSQTVLENADEVLNWDEVLKKRVSIFLQQSGLSYKELLELLGTYFINPVKNDGTRTLSLVSTDPGEPATCNLSKLEILGLDGKILGKIHRFVRLWGKLGWTMRDLDKAITALNPTDLNDDFLTQLSHIQRLRTELKIPLITILSWWANIDIASYTDHLAEAQPEVASLYKQLFRNKAVIHPVDEAFTEDASGLNGKLSEHLPSILAALGISAADLSLLTTGTAAVVIDDKLNLVNLSHLYRVATFAKALKLSIREYLSIQKLTSIDPFAAIPATTTEPLISATGATLRFAEKVDVIRASGFSIIELDYLLQHEYVASSRVAPSDQSIALILAEIHDGLQKIAAEYAFVPDPTGELTRKTLVMIKPALQWEDADIEQAIALLDGSAVYAEPLPLASPLTIKSLSSVTSKISYDTAAKELRCVGSMSEGEKTLLLSFSSDEKYRQAVDQLSKSAIDGQTIAVSLNNLPLLKILELGQSKLVYDSKGMLRFIGTMTLAEKALLLDLGANQTAIDALFLQPRSFVSAKMISFVDPADVKTTLLDQGSSREDKFDYVLTRLMAYVRISLGKSLVKQKLGEALKLEAALIELLLETLLKSRADANQPAMSDFLALLDGGLSATYFDNQDLTGPTVKRTDPTINFNWNSGSPDPSIAGGTFSAQWIGEVQPQHSETYTFFARTDGGVRLWLDNQLIIDQWRDQPAAEHSATMALKAAQLYDIKMDYYRNGFDAVAELSWSSPSTPRAIVSADHLFPDAPVLTYQSLHKIARLISALKISDEELMYISTHSAGQKWLDVTALPLVETQSSALLFTAWERIVDLFRFRDSLPPGKIHLFSIFKQAANPTTTKTELLKVLSERTGWSLNDLEFLDSPQGLGLTFPAAYKDERALVRLQACFKLMKRLGASAKQLSDWGKANQTTAEEMDNARSIKNAVKAKYDDKQWLVVAKPLQDVLREKQRAALVSYLVAERRVRDANELYKDFLMDLEMSPCMMTTRIKQAISSVQLFIQRCLMNLESDVSLTLEEAKEWREWRKQYRVWEANRKVFLYPENWIEPELRDDKSPFFKDLENELLQNDVTMDTAETAFLHYLEKLDEVARLEIVGMYQQKEIDTGNEKAIDILHVFGRTYAIPHTYYYCRREDSVWSSWEKVDLDIEGDHLIPVVWNRRLYLFWPVFAEKAEQPSEAQKKSGADPQKYWEIKFAWSEYKYAKWLAKRISTSSLHYLKHPSPNVPQDQKDFSFKTRVLQGAFGEQQIINCYSTKTDPGSNPGSIPPIVTINNELLVSVGKSALVIDFVFQIEVQPLRPSEASKIQIKALGLTFSLNTNGTTTMPGPLFPPGTDLYLVSAAYAVKEVTKSESWETVSGIFQLITLRYQVELKPWSPPSPQAAPTPTYKLMQAVGRFSLDYCQADLGAVPDTLVIPSIDPAQLEPIQGTRIQNMTTIEYSNWTDRLGTDGVLAQTPGTFRLMFPHQGYIPQTFGFPFFFQDEKRTYFVSVLEVTSGGAGGFKLRFSIFYHPWVCEFIKSLNRWSIAGLLTLANQSLTDDSIEFQKYLPNQSIVDIDSTPDSTPRENVDFSHHGSYSLYNWELFFHAPLLIATRLSKNQKFDEAQKWFHYIFDPTSTESPDQPYNPGVERFWKVEPFYKESQKGIQTLYQLMEEAEVLNEQVSAWRHNPFKPHVIARLRIVAYMKTVVMKYIDNLIAWGDQLFRRDTIESINEATQLYILATQILGKLPEEIPARAKAKTQTFYMLNQPQPSGKSRLDDDFSNAMVEIENFVPPAAAPTPGTGNQSSGPLLMPYFCMPKNDKLLAYWSTVADRLFKIRHCMNIEGVVRQLPIFEPPIDPAILVRAAAAGVDISSALNDINAALPNYRFNVMLQKAAELCNDVKALGSALLSALEKRDAEVLTLLRSGHEIKLLNAVQEVRKQQIKEAEETLEGLKKAKLVTEARRDYYKDIIKINVNEQLHMDSLGTAHVLNEIAQGINAGVAAAHLFPNFDVGTAGWAASPVVKASFGGNNLGNALQAAAGALNMIAAQYTHDATMASIKGGYDRRWDDWKQQEKLANKELDQIDKQIAAAEIRKAIADLELKNHDLQVENAKEVEAFMRDKYTNQELYNWMVGQISSIYFQSYKMAYDIAKRAERAFRHELGLADANFIQFGYWDSLKKGLLAGERLHYDLKRMDITYLDQNKREYEITKHVSLVLHDPMALIALKEIGQCEVELPETLFDADYPGHYMRRLKSVSLTIPAVVGPYTSINCTLTLLSSKTRINTSNAERYAVQQEDQVISNFGAIQSITTSHAQNDSGMFELNFRDERYLPFEGAGAMSRWRIDMPKDTNAFDFNTLSDVVLHLKYTAREGGDILKRAAKEAMQATIAVAGTTPLARLFSAKHEFPTDWHRFMHPADPAPGEDIVQKLPLALTQERFPFQLRGRKLRVDKMHLFLKLKEEFTYDDDKPLALVLKEDGKPFASQFMKDGSPISNLPYAEPLKGQSGSLGQWSLEVKEDDVKTIDASLQQKVKINGQDHVRLHPDAIEDVWIVCEYQVVK